MTDLIELFRSIKQRPSLFMHPVKYDSAVSLMEGYNLAVDGHLLEGFHEWTNIKLGFLCQFHWGRIITTFPDAFGFPGDFREEESLVEREKIAIAILFNELEEFYMVKKDRSKGLRWIYAQYDELRKKLNEELENE